MKDNADRCAQFQFSLSVEFVWSLLEVISSILDK